LTEDRPSRALGTDRGQTFRANCSFASVLEVGGLASRSSMV